MELSQPYERPTVNPFTPTFGTPPNNLVGMGDVIQEIMFNLSEGPRHHGYVSTLLAPRGGGKTVMLEEIQNRASAAGWFVVSLDDSSAGLEDRLLEEIRDALVYYDCADEVLNQNNGNVTSRRVSYTINVGVGSRESESSTSKIDKDRQLTLRRVLRWFGEYAASCGNDILLTLDELHDSEGSELRRLAKLIQGLTRRKGLPIAFLGAALPQFAYTALQDPKMTFFQRSHRLQLPHLTYSQAWGGLRSTIMDADGAIDREALTIAAKAVGSLPFTFQSVGHHIWEMGGAPHHTIDAVCTEEAANIAKDDFYERVAIPSWNDLGDTQRELMCVLKENGGRVFLRHLNSLIPSRDLRTIKRAVRQLEAMRYAAIEDSKVLVLTAFLDGDALERLVLTEREFAAANSSQRKDYGNQFDLPGSSRRCNHWMPRANAHCILPKGHKGGHRSKISRAKH